MNVLPDSAQFSFFIKAKLTVMVNNKNSYPCNFSISHSKYALPVRAIDIKLTSLIDQSKTCRNCNIRQGYNGDFVSPQVTMPVTFCIWDIYFCANVFKCGRSGKQTGACRLGSLKIQNCHMSLGPKGSIYIYLNPSAY